jgi:hypothetical protein
MSSNPNRIIPLAEVLLGCCRWTTHAKVGFDAIAGDAGMTLDNLDSGFYKPD